MLVAQVLLGGKVNVEIMREMKKREKESIGPGGLREFLECLFMKAQ
jgi:hypothetical protein